VDILRYVPGCQHQMLSTGRLPVLLLLLLLAFLVTFVLTRAHTRLARSRGWGSGSVFLAGTAPFGVHGAHGESPGCAGCTSASTISAALGQCR
jgi:hypothetical protein